MMKINLTQKWAKIFLPIIILLISLFIAALFVVLGEKPKKFHRPQPPLSVEVFPTERSNYSVVLETQGTVKARTESSLIPEISGRITTVSDAFRSGGFFKKDQLLVQIDPRNYKIDIRVAEAYFAEQQFRLEEEQARVKLALKNWKKINPTTKASDLTLHIPQLKLAQAALDSAKAQLEKAQINLEKTQIIAPYDGRIVEQLADVGQFVSTGSVLARIYSVDVAEIRLPLNNQQIEFLDFEDDYFDSSEPVKKKPSVEISAKVGLTTYTWAGHIARAEGSIDIKSRQLFIVAQVANPYGKVAHNPPLKVGQYVTARIKGKELNHVFVIPRIALRENNKVLIITPENTLSFRTVTVLWSDEEHYVISEGLNVDERLCITPINFVTEGRKVKIYDAQVEGAS